MIIWWLVDVVEAELHTTVTLTGPAIILTMVEVVVIFGQIGLIGAVAAVAAVVQVAQLKNHRLLVTEIVALIRPAILVLPNMVKTMKQISIISILGNSILQFHIHTKVIFSHRQQVGQQMQKKIKSTYTDISRRTDISR